MEDTYIIELFWSRDESAIQDTWYIISGEKRFAWQLL